MNCVLPRNAWNKQCKSSAVSAIGSTARKVVSFLSSNGYTFKIMEYSALEPNISQSTLMCTHNSVSLISSFKVILPFMYVFLDRAK